MDSLWLALTIFLVLEGIGPMLFPKKWRSYIRSVSELPPAQIQLVGGIFVVVGVVSAWVMLA